MASDPATSIDLDSAKSQARRPRWFASWVLWLLLLFVAVGLIVIAIGIPTYQRMLAIRYLKSRGETVEFSTDGQWLTERFGEFGTALRSVERIVCDQEMNDRVLQHVATLGEVKYFYIGNTVDNEPLTESGVAAFQSLDHLEYLTVQGNVDVVGDQDLFAGLFAARPPLIRFEKYKTPISVAALRELTQIESLEMLQLPVDEHTSLQDLDPLPNLKHLALVFEGPFDMNWLPSCPRLTDLLLYGPLTDEDLRRIADLTTLESLWFGIGCETHVTEAGVAHLENLTNLRRIVLPADLITPATVDVFRKLPVLEAVTLDQPLGDRELLDTMSAYWTVFE